MKILFIYSNVPCGCTNKYTFDLSEALKKYTFTKVIYYTELNDEIVKEYDIIILQRLGTSKFISMDEKENILKIIKDNKKDRKFIYMIDDLILEAQNGLPKIFAESCNAVLCTSDTLAKHLRLYNPNVYTFHTFINVEILDKIPSSKYDKFTVAWASTGSFGRNIIKEIINRRDELKFDFNLIAIGKYSNEFNGVEGVITYPILQEEKMINVIKGAQVLLNPVIVNENLKADLLKACSANLDDFLNSKSEIKYAISGITKTCLLTSCTDSFTKVIKNDVNGIFLEDNPKAWLEAIEFLYNNQDKAQIIAQNAYEHVKKEYTSDVVAKQLIDIFKIL